jgi:glycosyltransferase involved in cell wall biosynthesis/SAM-dependent methyltransferase
MLDKTEISRHFDQLAPQRAEWFNHNYLYHKQIIDCCAIFLNPESRVLELGCSVGNLIAALKPAYAVGVDISGKSIRYAAERYPQYRWICADVEDLPEELRDEDPFDIIIIEDLAAYLADVQGFLQNIRHLMGPKTRLIISTWNWMWEPILRAGEFLRLKTPDIQVRQNWISSKSLVNFLELANYDVLEVRPGLLFPYHIPFISENINLLSHSQLLSRITLLTTIVARPIFDREIIPDYSVSVIIPTRNEIGNIRALVERTPEMGKHTELIFVDGNSTDGTVDEIQRLIKEHPERDIRFIPQVPDFDPETPPNLMLKLGKGDAVRKGFATAKGDILMILDSDISVLPEDLRRFYDALVSGKAQFANGTRFIYEQEPGAMKPMNRLGNIFFSLVFSWLLNQDITDTLCGTKVLFKKDYEAIAKNRSYFGDFDPFGDFDLLFGAAWLEHKIKEIPIRYQARTYGESKVRINTHGPLLAWMSLIGLWQLKIRPWFGKPHSSTDDNAVQTSRGALRIGFVGTVIFLILLLVKWILGRRSK